MSLKRNLALLAAGVSSYAVSEGIYHILNNDSVQSSVGIECAVENLPSEKGNPIGEGWYEFKVNPNLYKKLKIEFYGKGPNPENAAQELDGLEEVIDYAKASEENIGRVVIRFLYDDVTLVPAGNRFEVYFSRGYQTCFPKVDLDKIIVELTGLFAESL